MTFYKKLNDILIDSKEIQSKIDELYNQKDPLNVSVFDKILGSAAIVGAVATIIVFISNAITQTSCEYLGWALITFALSSFEAFFHELTGNSKN